MDNHDFAKLNRAALLTLFEQERQEWLDAGMSEADIHRIHFGEDSADGRGGDYGVWLSERKHTRSDHKYAPGTPAVIDTVDPDNAWISDSRDYFGETETRLDIESALATLPSAQSELVRAVVLGGLTPAEYARDKHINKSVVSRTLGRARKKIKKFFDEGN